MAKTAIEIFKLISDEIGQAERDKDIYLIPRIAEKLGMQGGETQRGLGQAWNYELTDQVGDQVRVHCRWYDTSKAFSIRPDRHIMEVSYEGAQGKLSNSGVYEE